MPNYGLCLLIPPGWERLDADPEGIARSLDLRWADHHLTDQARSRLLDAQVAAVGRAKVSGIVLWAARQTGAGTSEDPLSLLSLTVAINTPPPTQSGTDSGGPAPEPAGASAPTRPARSPLSMMYDHLAGVMEERRLSQPLDDLERPIPVFQAQASIVPADHSAVITVVATTPDPAREDEARRVVASVASTLWFAPLPESTQA